MDEITCLNPFCTIEEYEVDKKEYERFVINELREDSLLKILEKSKKLQIRLCKVPIQDRLEVLEKIGRLWAEKLDHGEYNQLKMLLSKSTGYSTQLIELEFSFVTFVLNKENIRKNLEYSFSKQIEGLHRFIEVEGQESYRFIPAGPVVVISSGNSLIPPLIPTVLSMATGNFTILKPSISNYLGIVEVCKLFKEASNESETARLMTNALAISYFTHDSNSLKYILGKAPIGVINFWGGEPARTYVSKLVSENPNHPRLLINGPLTGVAIIDEESANENVAENLALNMVLYDQQLCSSPTRAIFIGCWKDAIKFAEEIGTALNRIGSEYPSSTSEGSIYTLQSVRRILRLSGSTVYASNETENMWTLIVSKGKSVLENVIKSFPEFNIYNRKRFIEMIVIEDHNQIYQLIEELPMNEAYIGVDKVQTVGLALSEDKVEDVLEILTSSGVYRIVPLRDMSIRSAIEPYDGVNLASFFTNTIYLRKKPIEW
ncbi:MAG: aldehyde dehydrogenase family protein [Nitrososphaeria archaeon]